MREKIIVSKNPRKVPASPAPKKPIPRFGVEVQNFTVTFDGSFTTGGYITDYQWNFGDGSTGEGIVVEHIYIGAGNYLISLTVTDFDGNVVTATKSITLVNVPVPPPNIPPVPEFTFTSTFLSVEFDASASTGTIATYEWGFGDGTTGSGVTPAHIYATAGTWIVTLTVTDNVGAQATYAHSVQVTAQPDQAPVSIFTYTAVDLTVYFDASASYDPDGTPITAYDWDFGDGTTGTGVTISHTYAADGSYTATLTVTS